MKTKYLLLLLSLAIGISCDDGIDTQELENTPAKIYLATSGYETYSILDFGETSKEFELYVNKSGFADREANVNFAYDASAVDDYISSNPEDLTILPASLGKFEQESVFMAGEQTLSKTKLAIDIAGVRNLIAENPSAKFVYPVRISTPEKENVTINDQKDYLLMGIELITPYAILKNKGAIVETFVDVHRNPNLTEISIPLEINLPFENDGYTFDFTYSTDSELLDAYNYKYGTNYELLPGFTMPQLKMAADENQCVGNIKVDVSAMPPSIGGKAYLLPVQITSSGNESIPVEENSICYFKVKMVAKWSGAWSNTIHSGESGLSTSAGTTYETFLYSRADALDLITESTLVAALQRITDEEAIVCPGWAGTMFEQCSPIIKVTDKDAGNGKKVVEILAGWAREGAGWEAETMGNNKSTYDPVKNEIYLDYTGKFGWGDYHIQRTFSNQKTLE
ncbi:hypothetical protein M2137_000340 [Parabacteroides sp. PFB2-10]|uniref:DUF1735 domain-containing protein n=1 Tax=Parabacteroides sp. PFB2-10 TaxID=1742405 RepID=UPI002476FD51|nr:DUF1735 domain-containing protein [Parabacteroides sp. PFB2-10]MDH6311590.1 hypothetical protein [Parabacteroides sp. PFB2-10]